MEDERPEKRSAIGYLLLLVAWLIYTGSANPRTGESRADFISFLIVLVITIALEAILTPKPKFEDARPAGLGDFSFPTATEGRVIPLVWGTVMIEGPNVIWYGDLQQDPITEKVKTGLFSSTKVVRGFHYNLGIQLGLCRGPIDELLGIWWGERRIFNGSALESTITISSPNLFGGDDEGQGGIGGDIDVYLGTTTQLISAYLGGSHAVSAVPAAGGSGASIGNVLTIVGGTGVAAQFQVTTVGGGGAVTSVALKSAGAYTTRPSNPAATSGPGTGCTLTITYVPGFQDSGAGTDRAPRYRRLAYLLLKQFYVGNSTQIKPIKVEVRRIPNGLGLTNPNAKINGGNDANIMNVAYEVLTNQEWGFNYAAGSIDSTSFTACALTLASEGNGFSMVLDRPIEAQEFMDELMRQADGVIYLDARTGLWKAKLVRADYDINTVPQLSKDSNVVAVEDFTQGSWNGTVNHVLVYYHDRAQEYKERPAAAFDPANAQIQGGKTVTTVVNVTSEIRYPGVKNATLAAQLATREQRSLSIPLMKGRFQLTRELWAVNRGDVLAYTGTLGGRSFTKLPVRVGRIEYGTLTEPRIAVDWGQDIWRYNPSAFGTPDPSAWTEPSDDLLPLLDLIIFEAPRGLLVRDPNFTGTVGDRIWAGGARRLSEIGFKINARISPAAYAEIGKVYGALFVGALDATLARGATTGGTFSVTMATATDKTDVLAAFTPGATPSDLGVSLVHLIVVDGEFMLVTSATSGAGNSITLSAVYRGVLDSVQVDHVVGASAWFLFVSGGLDDNDLVAGSTYDVKLLPFSIFDEVLLADVTAVSVPMDNRLRRPLPPGQLKLNTVADDTTSVSLEGTGSGDTLGILLDITRRDYRQGDEVQALTVDAAQIFADFPAANIYEHQVEVRNDPAGANTLLFTVAYTNASSITLARNDVLKGTDGVLPTTLGLVIRARHTDAGTQRTSKYDKTWAFTVATALSGQFNFGALDQAETSNLYTATQNGTYNFTLNTAIPSGTVEYRLNAGAWTTLIATSGTTGAIAGVVATNTIEVRHGCSTSGYKSFLAMDAPSTGQDAYAVVYKP